jgi:hypothetical protein
MIGLPWTASRREKIFINYRRDDAGGYAGRLSDTLADYFGHDRVFRDVTGIDYGSDFEQVIAEKLAESGAVVVLMGDNWTSVTDKNGNRRLDDPGDYVRREIAAALQSKVPVVPVLIGEAVMPPQDVLPEDLQELTRRNAMTITDERWSFDVTRLAKVLAIDVPGSVAQRRLDLLRSIALLLLILSGVTATVAFCAALKSLLPAGTALKEAGFTPLISAVPFISLLLAGTAALVAAPFMEDVRRRYAWAATALAYVGTLGLFVYYGMRNVDLPTWSLVVNFGVSVVVIFGVLALMTLAGFRAK